MTKLTCITVYSRVYMLEQTKVNPDTGRPTSDLSEEAVRWFRKSGFRVSTVGDVIPKATKRMLSRVQLAIDRVNAKTPKISQRIIRWTFLPEQFTIETGEIGNALNVTVLCRITSTSSLYSLLSSCLPSELLQVSL